MRFENDNSFLNYQNNNDSGKTVIETNDFERKYNFKDELKNVKSLYNIDNNFSLNNNLSINELEISSNNSINEIVDNENLNKDNEVGVKLRKLNKISTRKKTLIKYGLYTKLGSIIASNIYDYEFDVIRKSIIYSISYVFLSKLLGLTLFKMHPAKNFIVKSSYLIGLGIIILGYKNNIDYLTSNVALKDLETNKEICKSVRQIMNEISLYRYFD